MKITEEELKPSRAYHKINTFRGEQRWMDTKEGHEECIVCTAAWQKAPLGLKRRQTAQQIKPVAIELCESEGIRQLVS